MHPNNLTEVSALERVKTLLNDIFGEAAEVRADSRQVAAVFNVLRRTFLLEWVPSASTVAVSKGIGTLLRARDSFERPSVPLLVVPFMSDASRIRCKDAGISWLDLSGNTEIRDGDLYVRIEGKPNLYKRPGRPRNPFAPKSSRIVRIMLESPAREYMQKELVQMADVSKALVSQVVDQLEHHGFVERLESGAVRVFDAALLADEWREHYNLTDHSITRGHVYSSGSGPDLVRTVAQKLNEWDVSYAFSGLSSAWHYAPFASFRLAVVYVDDPVAILNAGTLGFTAETRGANVWIVAPSDSSVFWSRERHEGIHFASPLQTYLDLNGHPERATEASAVMRSYLSEKW